MRDAVDEAVCPHTALAPHWERPDDMGRDELATYRCESCGESFSYEEARELMDHPPALLVEAAEVREP